jgi:hypothetical protein
MSFYDIGAPLLWGIVIGVLSSYILGTLTRNANVKAISALAAFIAGSLSAKYFFKNATNATIFWFLLGLSLIWLFYWALSTKLEECPHCHREL